MESSASSKDSKRSLIWSHFTQIDSDHSNYSIRLEMKKTLFAQH